MNAKAYASTVRDRESTRREFAHLLREQFVKRIDERWIERNFTPCTSCGGFLLHAEDCAR